MSYVRVIPRDLFNEGNLLKCLGRLWCLLDESRGHNARLIESHAGDPFRIEQSDADGSISVANLHFHIAGKKWHLSRPLNSREAWPLYCESADNEIQEPVFDDGGWFTAEFKRLIMGLKP